MKQLSILLPYYWVRVRKGETAQTVCLLVDGYFMKFVEFAPRRLLLLFPEKLLKHQVTPSTNGFSVKPSQKAEEVIELIQETYRELRTYSFLDPAKRIMKSKLNLVLPPRRTVVSWNEGEVKGALMIYEMLFGKAGMSEGISLQEYKLIHLAVKVLARGHGWVRGVTELKVRAPKPIPKIYEFLYRVDEGFREAMNEVLNRAET